MHITCWGSRGSIPVSGKNTIKYGGDTTCIEIRSKNGDTVIIDAGTGIRRLGKQLIEQNRCVVHLLFTHAHWDHLLGFPFFRPLFSPQSKVVMHTGPFTEKGLKRLLSDTMRAPYFPVSFGHIKARLEYRDSPADAFSIGSLTIVPIRLSHPNSGWGYKFIEDGKIFVFLTDNELGHVHPGGLSMAAYVEYCAGADVLFHDAEYTPEEYEKTVQWGHSVYTDVLELAGKANVKTLGLFHLNQDRTDDEMDELINIARRRIQQSGYAFNCVVVASDMHIEI